MGALPEVRTEMVGFRDEPRPMTLEFAVARSVLNLETDSIEGWLRIKDMQAYLQSLITGIRVDLVQQEIQGSTKVSASELGTQPYRLRVLKQHEVVDGCSVGDLVGYRIPLRGACKPYLCPTVTNVFNKFSVRFFVRVVVVTERIERHVVEGEDEDVIEEKLV